MRLVLIISLFLLSFSNTVFAQHQEEGLSGPGATVPQAPGSTSDSSFLPPQEELDALETALGLPLAQEASQFRPTHDNDTLSLQLYQRYKRRSIWGGVLAGTSFIFFCGSVAFTIGGFYTVIGGLSQDGETHPFFAGAMITGIIWIASFIAGIVIHHKNKKRMKKLVPLLQVMYGPRVLEGHLASQGMTTIFTF